jgi:molecular chaperone DnaK (HSP70)
MWLGVDFGTSLSSAARVVDAAPRPVKFGANQTSMPSSAYVDARGQVLVGLAAEPHALETDCFKREFKLDLGGEAHCLLRGRRLRPEQLAARILGQLKLEAERQWRDAGEIARAVLTVPAVYEDHKRKLMIEAGKAAGFARVELLDEPVAAAIYYAWRSRAIEEGETALIYDLGGGTFDAALIQRRGADYAQLAPPLGSRNGGVEIDRLLLGFFWEHCDRKLLAALEREDANGEESRAIAAEYCRRIKHRLSYEDEVEESILLPEAPRGRFRVTRDEFNGLIAPAIDQTLELCRRSIAGAGLEPKQLGKALLVGGSCRIPYVRQAVERALGCSVMQADDLELAVCLGAALHGATFEKPAANSRPAENAAQPAPPSGKTKKEKVDVHAPDYQVVRPGEDPFDLFKRRKR